MVSDNAGTNDPGLSCKRSSRSLDEVKVAEDAGADRRIVCSAVSSCDAGWLRETYIEKLRYNLEWTDPVTGRNSRTPREGPLRLDLSGCEQSRKVLGELFWCAGCWTLRAALKQKGLDERSALLENTNAAVQDFNQTLEDALCSAMTSPTIDHGVPQRQPSLRDANTERSDFLFRPQSWSDYDSYSEGESADVSRQPSPVYGERIPEASASRKTFHISLLTAETCRTLVDEFLRLQGQRNRVYSKAGLVSLTCRHERNPDRSHASRSHRGFRHDSERVATPDAQVFARAGPTLRIGR